MFRAVVERGGVTAAAEALSMPKSSVSKTISRLELALGVRLLERNTRRVRVTTEGQAFFKQCQLIMEQVEEADAVVAGLTSVPSGRLAVAVPPAFCQQVLAPHLGSFRTRYPKVELELVATSGTVDIVRDQLDVAVVVGAQSNSDLACRPLLAGKLVWIASPSYLERNTVGDEPADLVPHIQICEQRYASRPLLLKWAGQTSTIDLRRGPIRVNDPLAVREAVAHGAGVSFLPDRYCREQLRSGELVEMARHVEFDISASILSVVYSGRRLKSARTRAFIDFLFEICSAGRDASRHS